MRVPLVLAMAACVASAAQAPTINEVMRRAGQYALEYEQKLSLLVAEETYKQTSKPTMAASQGGNLSTANPSGRFGPELGREQRRILKSDYLLVRLDGGGWMPFRDVFEVDGRKERNREDRILNLFLKPSASSLDQARRIMADSTRYNLGSVERTTNIPTLAVLFAQPDLASRFGYDRAADQTVAGRTAWVFAYREVARPSLIKTSKGEDLTLTGRLWIDPATGVILKTNLVAATADVRAIVTVTFREDKTLALWVPARMEETYHSRGSDEINCVATYSNYRRFNVATDEQVKKPPPL